MSWPVGLTVSHGLSAQAAPEIVREADHVAPWLTESAKLILLPCIQVAKTSPEELVASVTSYCPWPVPQAGQIGLALPQVTPSFAETLYWICTFVPLYCIHAAYTYGPDGSAAMAGSQPSP